MASDGALEHMRMNGRLIVSVILCLLMLSSLVPNLPAAAGSRGAVENPLASDMAPEYSKFIQVNNFRFDPLAEAPNVPSGLSYDQPAPGQKAYFIVQFDRPITDAMKSGLGAAGVELLHYINYNGFIVSADGPSLERAKALSSVRWAGMFEPAYKLSPRLSEQYDQILANAEERGSVSSPGPASSVGSDILSDSVGTSEASAIDPSRWSGKAVSAEQTKVSASPSTTIEVLITTFDSSWVDEVSDSVYGLGGNGIMVSYKMWGTVRAIVDRGVLSEIARLPGVMWIDRQSDPHIFNDIARWVIQSSDAASFATPIHDHGIWGTGQVVTLADTGIDYDHAAFYDPSHPTPGPGHRKVTNYYIPAGGWGDGMDNGINHGSHTAGTIGGDDGTWHVYDGDPTGSSGSAGPHDGQAFDATLQMQDVSQDGFGVGAPADMHDLFQPALDNGSWIHSNSWGSYGNQYSTEASQTDDFLWDNQEFIVAFAAGNNGPYLGSINPFAVAKNVIGVGATENGPAREGVTDFSSRGPCADGRLKPDVMAPGYYIWSVQGMDPSPTTDSYWQLSGTSMATPTLAGAATLVRQYFMDGFYPTGAKAPSSGFTPSAALVKAMLINSASEMTGLGAYDNGENYYPNDNQGWGRVLLDDAMYFQGDARTLFLEDNRAGISTGTSLMYNLAIGDASQPVEITLVWTDYPGLPMSDPALVNDLNLVAVDPSGDVFRGNAYSGYNPGESIKNPNGSVVDHINNVESVLVITAPEPGLWTVTVTGYNVPHGPQPYALVMTGGIATDRGMVSLDRSVYKSSSTAGVRVIDIGLNADPLGAETVWVNITSSTETIPEPLLLTETGLSTGLFTGSIQLESSVVPVTGDGILQVLNGDNITAEYFDADDGLGGSGLTYARAYIDDDPPVISSVQVGEIRFNHAAVSWQTSENSDSVAVFGSSVPPSSSVTDLALSTVHELDLRSLEQETTYYFYVTSTDAAGNTAVDDNSSAYFKFTTSTRPPEPPSDIEWPTFHNNVARTGNSPSAFTPPLEAMWQSSSTYDTYWSGPTVADGMVFSTSSDGYIRTRDAFSGELIWERLLGAPGFFTAQASVSGGLVYAVFDEVAGSNGSTLYAIDEFTGEDVWTIPPSPTQDLSARSSLAVADGMVFGGAWTGQVFAVDAATGESKWSYNTSSLVIGSVAVSSGQVIAANYAGEVVCLDEYTGGFVWSAVVGGEVISSPTVAAGNIYVATITGGVYCLDESDGGLIWSNTMVGPIYFSTPAFDGSAIYFGNDDGVVISLDAFDGTELWRTTVSGWIESSVAHANGYLYVSESEGYLEVLDTADGAIVASYPIGPYSTSSPAVSDGWIWVEDDYGRMSAFFGVMPVAVRVSPISQMKEAVPGTATDFSVDVTNAGSSGPDLFDMNVTLGANGWTAELYRSDGITPIGDTDSDGLPDTGWLAIDETMTVIIRVSVPGSAPADLSEDTLVTFVSADNPDVLRTAKVISYVPPPGVSIGPKSYFPVNPGETTNAPLTVRNTGAFQDTIDIGATSQHGWSLALFEEDGVTPLADTDGDSMVDTGPLPPLGSAGIVVKIQVPGSAPLGALDRTVVGAHSSLDPNGTDSCFVILELAPPVSNDWPTFHNNVARVGMSTCAFAPPLELEWSAGPFANNVLNGPVVADGMVFATSVDGSIRAFDAFTGVDVWQRQLGGLGYYSGTPTVESGVVYVTFSSSPGERVYALDQMTGATIWSVGNEIGLEFSARAPIAVSSGLVISTAWDSVIYALDASDGSLVWTFDGGGYIYGGVAVSGGLVFFGNSYGQVYALNERTGTEAWFRGVSGDVLGTPMAAHGSVYVATLYGRVYSLDVVTGNTSWVSTSLGSFMYVTPAYDGSSVYVGSATGYVYSLDVEDGGLLWSQYVGEYITSSVGVSSGYLYFTDGSGMLVSMDATDGTVVDSDALYSYESTSSVAISDGWVWAQDLGGYLYGFQGVLEVGLRIQPTFEEKEALPSSTVDYTVTVTNIGSSGSDTFDASVTPGANGWGVELLRSGDFTPLPDTDSDGLPDTGSLNHQEFAAVVARVTVPADAWPGGIELSRIRFTSSNDEGVFREFVAATLIPPPGVALGPNGYEYSAPGATVSFPMTATNTGAITDLFDLTVNSSSGWTVSLYQSDGATPLQDTDGDGVVDSDLVPGLGAFDFVVNVTVSAGAEPGSICTVTVTATSNIDPEMTDSAKARVEVTSSQSSDWPSYQHDSSRTGVAPEDYSLPLTTVWTYSGTGGESYGTSPVVADGVAYYTSTSGYMMAVDAATGEELWVSDLGAEYQIMGTPAVYNGKIFVPFTTTAFPPYHFGALDAQTGQVVWTSSLSSDASLGTPVVASGLVYVGDAYGYVYAFDTDSGELIWRASATGPINMGPSLVEGRLMVGTGAGYLYAFNLSGGLEWSRLLTGSLFGAPSGSFGMVFVGSWDGYVYGLEADTGNIVWTRTLDDPVYYATPVVWNGAIYISDLFGSIHCMDALTGADLWQTDIYEPTPVSGVINNGTLFMPSVNGSIAMMDALTGALKGRVSVSSEPIESGLAISRGYMYVIDDDGVMTALSFAGAGVIEVVEAYPSTAIVPVSGFETFTVYGYDRYGNLIPHQQYGWWFVSGSGTLVPISATADECLFIAGTEAGEVLLRVGAGSAHADVAISVVAGDISRVEVSPATASVVAGSDSLFTATAYDGFGNEATGEPVQWNTTIGTIDPDGTLHAGTASGTGTVTATIGGLHGHAAITVLPGAPDHLSVVPESLTVAAGSMSVLGVSCLDGYGNEIDGLAYEWATSIGTISSPWEPYSAVLLAGPTAGTGQITVACEGLTIEVSVEVVPGPASTIELTPSEASISAGTSTDFSTRFYDTFGNEILGPVADFSVEGSIGTIDATGMFTAGTATGSGRVVATLGTLSATADVTVVPGALHHISLAPASVSAAAGSSASLSASGFDQHGNAIVGLTYSWSTTIGSVSPIAGTPHAMLQASTSAGWGNVTVSSGGVSASAQVHVVPSSVASVAISPSLRTVVVGGTQQFAVSCADAFGNPVEGMTATYEVSGGIGTISTGGLFTAGTAAGSGMVMVSVGGMGAQAMVTVAPGPLAEIVLTPSLLSLSAGGAMTLNATCLDQYGNELAPMALTWASTIGSVTVVGEGGQAVFHAGAIAGDGTIQVGSGSTSVVVGVTVEHGPLASLVLDHASLAMESGNSESLVVKAYDAFGNEIDGLSYSWAFQPSSTEGASGTISPGVDSSGASFVADGAGTGTIIVSSGGETAQLPVTVEGKASTLSSVGPSIAISALLVVVIVLLAMYFLVWKKKMVPPREKPQQ